MHIPKYVISILSYTENTPKLWNRFRNLHQHSLSAHGDYGMLGFFLSTVYKLVSEYARSIQTYSENIWKVFKGTVAWDDFLAWTIPYVIVSRNLKKILICIIIYGDIHTFISLGVLGEYAKSLFASSPCTHKSFPRILEYI